MLYIPREEDFDFKVYLRPNAADPKSLYAAYFEHNPEGYGEYDPTAETDGTHFRQDYGFTSLYTQLYEQTQTVSYALPVETSSDWSSSPSGTLQQMGTSPLNGITFSMNPPGEHSEEYGGGHPQQVDTPSLNDNTFSMDTSGDNMTLDSDSEEKSDEDDVPTLGDHGPTNPPGQKEKPYKCCLFCGRGFSSQNAVTRHFDDIHSEPKQCHQPGCQKMIIGKRKLVAHLKRVHGHSRKPGKKGLNVLRRAQASSREA